MTNDATARPSFLGYLYQVEYALYILISSDQDDAYVAIEYLDDVTFSKDGSAKDLLQLKHTIRTKASLTDSSPELWKTIRNWCFQIQNGSVASQSILSLVSTSIASPNSIPYALKSSAGRDNREISKRLLDIANSSSNQGLQSAFSIYRSLTSVQQEQLVKMIQVLDGEPNILDLPEAIKPRLFVRYIWRDQFYGRLLDWWFDRVKRHVIDKSTDKITRRELIDKIADLNDQFRPDSLPIDFRNVNPPETPDAEGDQRIFVHQLRQIMLNNREIELAIIDYYRAFEQRSKWEREQLVNFNELEQYENRLKDEWERMRLRIERQRPQLLTDENGKLDLGRLIFDECSEADFLRIRDNVTEPYVRRGSLHILANGDSPAIFWHPQFVERLKTLIPEPTTPPLKRPYEVSNLLNSAFGTRVLRASIKSYQHDAKHGMPFALSFLILPIILYKPLRQSLPRTSATKMHVWLREHREAFIEFTSRAQRLVPVTRNSLMFGMHTATLHIDDNAYLHSTSKPYRAKTSPVLTTQDVKEIEQRAEFLGKWFARAGSPTTIFIMWGVRP